jgi:hypothetical protein
MEQVAVHKAQIPPSPSPAQRTHDEKKRRPQRVGVVRLPAGGLETKKTRIHWQYLRRAEWVSRWHRGGTRHTPTKPSQRTNTRSEQRGRTHWWIRSRRWRGAGPGCAAGAVYACAGPAPRPNALQNDRRRWRTSSGLTCSRSSYSEKTPGVAAGWSWLAGCGKNKKTRTPTK